MTERRIRRDIPVHCDPSVPFCKGGSGICEVCVGSCGIEEEQELMRARLGLGDPEDERYDPRSEWFDDGTGQVQQ